MKLIDNNPFRILGIPVNASAKNLAANKGKMKLLDIGKDVAFPLDLPELLSPINRSKESVAIAERDINLPQDKLRHALMWFAQPTDPLGKLAYDHLLQGNIDTAITNFKRSTSWESRLCLSTICLIKNDIPEALSAIWSVIDLHCGEFVASVAGQTFSYDANAVRSDYLSALASMVDIMDVYPQLSQSNVPDNLIDELRTAASAGLVAIIEKEIAKAKAVDKDNAPAQLEAGKTLSNNTHRQRIKLEKLLGKNDPRYSRLVDKLANQVLQSSINYFNNIEGENREIIDNALKLGEYALRIAVGKIAIDHIQHNVEILRKKKANLPPEEVEEHDAAIKAKILELIVLKGESIDNAIQLMKDCAPHVVAIKEHPELRQYYLNISTQIVNAALSSVIEEHNKVSKDISTKINSQLYRDSAITTLKNMLKKAWKATVMMDRFDMEDDFKNGRYAENRKALKEMYENVFGSYSSGTMFVSFDEFDLRTEEEMFKGCLTSVQYQAYMKRYPNGKYVAEARVRYQRLLIEEEKKRKEKEEKERKARIEREADDKAYNSCTSIGDYETYLRNHPNGRHTHEAKKKIKSKKETLTNVLSVILVELVWLIIGLIFDDYDTNWWAVFLGGTIGGWLFYVNILAFTFFNWLISKIIDNEN